MDESFTYFLLRTYFPSSSCRSSLNSYHRWSCGDKGVIRCHFTSTWKNGGKKKKKKNPLAHTKPLTQRARWLHNAGHISDASCVRNLYIQQTWVRKNWFIVNRPKSFYRDFKCVNSVVLTADTHSKAEDRCSFSIPPVLTHLQAIQCKYAFVGGLIGYC